MEGRQLMEQLHQEVDTLIANRIEINSIIAYLANNFNSAVDTILNNSDINTTQKKIIIDMISQLISQETPVPSQPISDYRKLSKLLEESDGTVRNIIILIRELESHNQTDALQIVLERLSNS